MGVLIAVLPPILIPSCPLEVEIAPLSEPREVLFASNSVLLPLFSQGGGTTDQYYLNELPETKSEIEDSLPIIQLNAAQFW